MIKRITHSYETKLTVIEMKKLGYTSRQIQIELGIKNVSQIKTWWRWYNNGEIHRLHQPIGKQYTFGKGPEGSTLQETLKIQNESLKLQVNLLKKYLEKERKWRRR